MVVVIMAYVSFPFSSLLFFPLRPGERGPGPFVSGSICAFQNGNYRDFLV